MRVSVIIPTYNRKNVLRKLLRFLADDPYVSEVIVVDDRSTDGTADMLRAEFAWVKYVQGKGMGQKHAKQDGLAVATGDIITFLDDDALPEEGWLRPVLEAFQNGARVVQSKVVFLNKGERNIRTDTKVIGKIAWNMRGIGRWNLGAQPRSIDLCLECGVFIRRDVLDKVPFFDPFLLGDGYGESISFSLRLKQAGIDIWYVPDSVINHLGADTGGSADRYKKSRATHCGPFLEIIVANLIYLNRRFRKWTLPFSIIYYLLAGCYLSIVNRKNCMKFVLAGLRRGLTISYIKCSGES